VIRNYDEVGLRRVSFVRLLQELGDDLFDLRTGSGRLILHNPAKMQARGGIGAIVLGETWHAAEAAADELFESGPAFHVGV
jgi:hypothetical protein